MEAVWIKRGKTLIWSLEMVGSKETQLGAELGNVFDRRSLDLSLPSSPIVGHELMQNMSW
jgi:hypothetical protein